jgi:hypothetical protein
MQRRGISLTVEVSRVSRFWDLVYSVLRVDRGN